jgi:hypothetical protein
MDLNFLESAAGNDAKVMSSRDRPLGMYGGRR